MANCTLSYRSILMGEAEHGSLGPAERVFSCGGGIDPRTINRTGLPDPCAPPTLRRGRSGPAA